MRLSDGWGWVGDVGYWMRERRVQRRFRSEIARGVMKQEPRYRPITRIDADVYDGYPPGSVEYAHVQRYDFASKRIKDCLVLNAASGSGYGNEILSRAPSRVIGLDLFENPLDVARAHFPRHCFVRGNVADMPMFRDRVFDAIVTFETIEHLPDPVRGMREFLRVLRPGGQLIGSVPIQIYHNPGTNFTWKAARGFVESFCPGSALFLQDNERILPYSESNWRAVRFEGNKYLLFTWTKGAV